MRDYLARCCAMLDRVIAEFEAQQEREQDKTAWCIQEQRILEDLAFPLWMQCRNAIETECKKYPKHLQFEVQPNTDASVRCPTIKKNLFVEYHPNSHSITYILGAVTRRYSMRVNNERQAVIWDQDRDIFKSAQDVADDLLSLLFS